MLAKPKNVVTTISRMEVRYLCFEFHIVSFILLSDYGSAVECYTEALGLYPGGSRDQGEGSQDDKPPGPCDHERAVCFANRAACHMKKVSQLSVMLLSTPYME